VEEPDLGEHDCGRGEPDRDRAAARDDERQQPHEVLRREDLRERQEAGDRGSEGQRQASAQVAEPGVEEPDRGNREGLERQQRAGDRIGCPAGQVAAGDAGRLDDVGVIDAEPVEHQQQGGAEALDLQPARGLRMEALVDPVRRVGRERRDDRRGHEHQRPERERRPPRAGAAPDEPGSERHEHERIHLRADGQPSTANAGTSSR